MVTVRDFILVVVYAAAPALHRHFHVGLAGANPDFAHQHVVQRNGVLPGNRHGERPAGIKRSQFHRPLTAAVGRAAHALIS